MPALVVLLILVVPVTLLAKAIWSFFKYRPNHGEFKGKVTHFTSTSETINSGKKTKNVKVLSFLIDLYNKNNNKIQSVPVEIRGQSISGYLADGNVVEIFDKQKKNQVLTPMKIYNETLSSFVKVKKK
jgi:hypothetical protein